MTTTNRPSVDVERVGLSQSVETIVDRSGERFGDEVTIAHLARYSFRNADGGKLTAYAAASIIRADWRDELWALTATDLLAIGGVLATFRDGSSLRIPTPNRYGKPVESYWREMGDGGVPAHEAARYEGNELVNRGGPLPLWSGNGAPPAVGDVVAMRGGGEAKVTGYIVESGWLMALAYRVADPSTRGTLAGLEIAYPA